VSFAWFPTLLRLLNRNAGGALSRHCLVPIAPVPGVVSAILEILLEFVYAVFHFADAVRNLPLCKWIGLAMIIFAGMCDHYCQH
jgi:hypothetical protein